MAAKILFILKRREDYNSQQHAQKSMSTGLYNSAMFMCDMMKDAGFECDIEVAVDNNCIDRLVTQHRPTHVVIEGLWVVPSKFSELIPLHPDVEWVIRLHSDMPFLAGEGMAMDWIGDYVKFPKVAIAANSPRMLHEMKTYVSTVVVGHTTSDTDRAVVYLPNYYPRDYREKAHSVTNRYRGEQKYWIDIGCFGAIRPLKNHLTQAVAAIKYANDHGKQLRFHINADRVEGRGEPILNNLRGMFQQLSELNHQLIAHSWQPREQFLELCATMDIGLQCNFSETFNIVTADMISRGVPVVGSSEIPWSSSIFNANPTESDQIAHAINRAVHHSKINVYLNQRGLTKYCKRTKKIWSQYFKEK